MNMIYKNPCLLALFISHLFSFTAVAQEQIDHSGFNEIWVVNEELSDDTDEKVEKAIKKMGGKPTKKKGKERYRGGPEDQALYDHISYDNILRINYAAPEMRFTYRAFERVFYTDGRGRTVSASGPQNGERRDYSFASWDGNTLVVESRPLDGGRTLEKYSLQADGKQLRVELHLEPLSFLVPIEIVRVYDRKVNID